MADLAQFIPAIIIGIIVVVSYRRRKKWDTMILTRLDDLEHKLSEINDKSV